MTRAIFAGLTLPHYIGRADMGCDRDAWHIVLDGEAVAGRARRSPGDYLCKKRKRGGKRDRPIEEGQQANCPRCLEMAADIVAAGDRQREAVNKAKPVEPGAVSEKTLRRIQLLLAKANDPACTEEEREVFLAGVQEQMIRHNVTADQVNSPIPGRGYVTKEIIVGEGKRQPIASPYVADVVTGFYFVRLLQSVLFDKADKHYPTVVFVGRADNVEMARYVFFYLLARFTESLETHCKARGIAPDKLKVREAYLKGLMLGLMDRLRRERESLARTEGLVVVHDPEVDVVADLWAKKAKDEADPEHAMDEDEPAPEEPPRLLEGLDEAMAEGAGYRTGQGIQIAPTAIAGEGGKYDARG